MHAPFKPCDDGDRPVSDVPALAMPPVVILGPMAFMLEVRRAWRPTLPAPASPLRQVDHARCWQGPRGHLDPA
ncbi:hypothetical protein [Methylibium petroleiphilum]|uniref:hypothetical protein n=1 Tax=Methylibium petroleiphilum TaxID=105560 RepID=UPI00003CD0EF|nr:hypothetical protein [Methylibium petroleiphilum]